jgi:hypothetical protein
MSRFDEVTRKTILGQPLPERDPKQKIEIDTRVPEKWLFIDMEVGKVMTCIDGKWERLDVPAEELKSFLEKITPNKKA